MITSKQRNLPPWQVRNNHFGIYIHYPYCFQKCDYCDFYSEGIGKDPAKNEQELFDGFIREIIDKKQISNDLNNRTCDTVFFGGGTPSKASVHSFERILKTIRNEFRLESEVEISIEVNPEDLDSKLLLDYASIGINRVNIGVQTTKEEGLNFLGRHYDKVKYKSLPEVLNNSPIQRVGIDLMYGIPGVSIEDFYFDLNTFLSIKLPHLSLYSLTLEKGTQYSRNVKDLKKTPPKEEEQIKILEELPNYLKSFGYEWYEVSNYCLPGFESQHNLKYWTYEPYLGIGPGAHGFLDGKRYGNPRNTNLYIRDPIKVKWENADPNSELALTLFRLFSPFLYMDFLESYVSPKNREEYLNKIYSWEKRGLCQIKNSVFQWKNKALLTLDDLILELISGS
ncbi:MAG: radical SAM family heme chaperone HemW [Leptospira sp.]|nr:radical SAM family heme chaperone HemW [Leptospira sp.]